METVLESVFVTYTKAPLGSIEIVTGVTSEGKGEPDTSVISPDDWLIENTDMVSSPPLVTKRNWPVRSTVKAVGNDPVVKLFGESRAPETL